MAVKWDLSTPEGMQQAAGWMRNRGGALMVLAITPRNVVCSIDPKLEPLEAVTLLRNELPQLLQFLINRRARKKGQQDAGTEFP